MLANKKLLSRNANFLSTLTGLTVFCYVYYRYDWNGLLSLVLCSLLAGLIAAVWQRGIESAGDEQKGLPAALSGRWWWTVVLANLLAVTWLLVWDLEFLTRAETVTIALTVAILLGYLAWIEQVYRQKGRAILFGISSLPWFLIGLLSLAQGLSEGNTQSQPPSHAAPQYLVAAFAFLGIYLLPIAWLCVDTLRKKDTLRALVAELASEHSQPVLDETQKLLLGLSSKFEAERVDAAKGLGKLTQSDERIIKALVTALNDEYQSVKRAARSALDAPAHQAFMQTRPEYQKYVSQG